MADNVCLLVICGLEGWYLQLISPCQSHWCVRIVQSFVCFVLHFKLSSFIGASFYPAGIDGLWDEVSRKVVEWSYHRMCFPLSPLNGSFDPQNEPQDIWSGSCQSWTERLLRVSYRGIFSSCKMIRGWYTPENERMSSTRAPFQKECNFINPLRFRDICSFSKK